ncbi:hypothetical protein AC578_5008 [Pseudocercospora eumusae]|uniref:Uncharacterized protein n=1 Tax=Pseudocercospora eumusae TaxID=321146 RepID=A0A139GTT3_9PEZI|nr:hypothetical protein AC578_5008 [Pseudocercospora eumusae]
MPHCCTRKLPDVLLRMHTIECTQLKQQEGDGTGPLRNARWSCSSVSPPTNTEPRRDRAPLSCQNTMESLRDAYNQMRQCMWQQDTSSAAASGQKQDDALRHGKGAATFRNKNELVARERQAPAHTMLSVLGEIYSRSTAMM